MADDKIKISDLPELTSLNGAYTVVSKEASGTLRSYKVDMTYINDAVESANSAASNANSKATAALSAAANATSAAQLANTKAALAETAATNADTKAALANTKAGLADTAATNANAKATLANTAAANANTAAARVESAIETAEADHTQAVADHTASVTATAAANEAAEAAEEAVETMEGTYAKKDGYYESMTVGRAENLVDVKGEGTPHEFIRRTSCGNDSIEDDGTATIKRIKGNTIVWNQLLSLDVAQDKWWGRQGNIDVITIDSDNVLSCTRNSSYFSIGHKFPASVNGHKMLFALTLLTGTTDYPHVYGSCISAYNQGLSSPIRLSQSGNRHYGIITAGNNINYIVFVQANAQGNTVPEGFEIRWRDAVCIDLTQMFGAGNEPSTVEEFEALFPASYYPYNEGQLLSLKAEGIVTDGFNQWDEEYQTGYWNSSGVLVPSSTSEICSKNPIKVFPNTAYYKRTSLNSRLPTNGVLFLDNNLNLIRSDYVNNLSLFTTPANCHYILFNVGTVYGPTYNHDICFNLSWSGYRNGEYEPYWKNTKALPIVAKFTPANYSAQSTYAVGDLCLYDGKMYKCSTAITTAEAWNSAHWTLIRASGIGEMLSAGTVYDELTEDGMVIRVGCVDMGTLVWSRYTGQVNFLYALVNEKAISANVVTMKYTTNTTGQWSNLKDKEVTGYATDWKRVAVRDDAYTDAASFKAAMSGVMLYYELAEPIVIPFGEKLNLTYKVADFGTETVSPDGVDEQGVPKTAPFRADIKYSDDFTRRIVNLPKNYQSQESMDAMLSALGAALGFTFTKTWDATNGKWTYTITKTS